MKKTTEEIAEMLKRGARVTNDPLGVKIGKSKPAPAPEPDPLAELGARLAVNLRETIEGALAERGPDAPRTMTKAALLKGIGDSLTKAATDLGILDKPDAPQHDVNETPPARKHSESAYHAQKRRNVKFITNLAASGFGDGEKPLRGI